MARLLPGRAVATPETRRPPACPARHAKPIRSSGLPATACALLAVAALAIAPLAAHATPITSAANIPSSGFAPGGVDMATGEIIIVCRPDLALGGPMPLAFERYYGSMLAREGLASGHLGPNWLGSFDWSLSMGAAGATVVTERGQRLQFQQSPLGGMDLVSPTDQKYRLQSLGGMWRLTYPSRRRVYAFDGTTLALSSISDEHGNSLSLTYSRGVLAGVSDGLGRALSFAYDALGHMAQVSDGTRTVTFGYTGGTLTSVRDAAEHTTTFAYAASPIPALLQSTTEPLGNTPATCAYDPLGRVVTMTDAYQNSASFAYDAAAGGLFTDALGHAWTFVHDAQSRLTTLTDPAAGSAAFAYDPLGRIASSSRPLGDVTTFSYEAASGLPASVTLGDGSVFAYSYSSHAAGGATFYDLSGATYPDGHTESFTRDAAGNLTDWRDRGDFHWTGTYNLRGQPLTSTNPVGGVSTFTYDPQGRLATSADNAGNVTSFACDALGRVTQLGWPDGKSQLFAYDALDRPTTLTDERGKAWVHAWDANGRPAGTTDPLLAHSTWSYDNDDRLTSATDPAGQSSTFAYDGAGRLVTTTDRTGNAMHYQYDAAGRVVGVTDPSGAALTYTCDANGRVTAVQDALGRATAYQYDAMDRVIHSTDPLGAGSDYGYDSMGRFLSAAEPLGHTQSFDYDASGLLAAFFDVTSETGFVHTPLGEVSQMTDPDRDLWPSTYDADGRMLTSADPLARTTSYAYDARGRLVHAQLPTGVEDLVYDFASRVTARNFSEGTQLGYSYDDANRLTGGTGAAFAYDETGRMTSSNGLAFARDAEGRVTSETFAPGKAVTFTYDSRGLLKSVADWIGGTTTFAYDTTGELVRLTRPDGTSESLTYDAAGRVSQWVEKSPPPIGSPLSSIAITRDALGRPTSINRSQPLMPVAGIAGTTDFAYDAASQITGKAYDGLGRLTGDGARTFSWDGASRLSGFASGAEAPAFTYDAFGNPLARSLAGALEQYGWNYASDTPTLDVVSQGGAPRTYYVHAPSGVLLHSIDATSGARSFYHFDEDGNTIFLTNDAGAVTTQYAYRPSGAVMTGGPASAQPFTFGGAGGAMQIGSGGLYRMGYAIYDAITSRIISGLAMESGTTGFFKSVGGIKTENEVTEYTEGGYDGGTHKIRPPGAWGMKSPGPSQSPGAWEMKSPGPSQSPGVAFPNAHMWLSSGWSSPPQYYKVHHCSDGYRSNGYNSNGFNSNGFNSNGLADNGVGDNGVGDNGVGDNGVGDNGVGDNGVGDNGVGDNGFNSNGFNANGFNSNGSITKVHKNPAFEIKDFSFEVENPTTIGSATTGAGAGKIKFNEFVIKKTADKASPTFFRNCVVGAHYKSVVINMRKAGGRPSPWGLTPANRFCPWCPMAGEPTNDHNDVNR